VAASQHGNTPLPPGPRPPPLLVGSKKGNARLAGARRAARRSPGAGRLLLRLFLRVSVSLRALRFLTR
jgi:hypothetical protein